VDGIAISGLRGGEESDSGGHGQAKNAQEERKGIVSRKGKGVSRVISEPESGTVYGLMRGLMISSRWESLE